MSKRWAEITLEVAEDLVEQLSDLMVEVTGSGVSVENRSVDTFSIDTICETPFKTLKAYLPDDVNLSEALRNLRTALSDFFSSTAIAAPPEPTVSFIGEEDWANSWKEHFKPARIGRRLVIKPTWEDFTASPEDLIIEIDPGMAFGTGTHPTTRLCLEMLEDIIARQNEFTDCPVEATSILDVGTGSGILAMAAAKLSPSARIDAIDIDSDAVRVAQENMILNGILDRIAASATPLANLAGPYSVILANILAEDLVKLSADLVRLLVSPGVLILSGILTEKEQLVTSCFQSHGLTTSVRTLDDWCAVACLKEF